jgi:hypothetical protein
VINNPIETMPFIAYDLKLFLQDLTKILSTSDKTGAGNIFSADLPRVAVLGSFLSDFVSSSSMVCSFAASIFLIKISYALSRSISSLYFFYEFRFTIDFLNFTFGQNVHTAHRARIIVAASGVEFLSHLER